MSADLLRRAATRLRESALAAPSGPWKVVYFGDRGYPQRVVDDRARLIAQTYEGADTEAPVRPPAATPDFIALVHPPVALALAELLDHVSDDYGDERAEEKDFPHVSGSTYKAVVDSYGGQRWDWTAALAVARAVLREPEGGAGCYALTNAGRGLECGIHGTECSFARQGREPEGGDRT